jgi:hypothetical protein
MMLTCRARETGPLWDCPECRRTNNSRVVATCPELGCGGERAEGQR